MQGLLHQVPYLEGLSFEVIADLASVAAPLHVPAGGLIFLEGEAVTGVYVIETGTVKVSRVSMEGREHILHMLNPGDTFNEVAALDGGPNPVTAMAYTDADLWCIYREDLQQVAERYHSLAWALVESIARRARYLLGLVEDLAMRSVRGRLAHLLLEQAEAYEQDAVPRLLTQQEMASQLGTVREVVGRALRGLAADGIIAFDRNRIVILDAQRLEQEAATR